MEVGSPSLPVGEGKNTFDWTPAFLGQGGKRKAHLPKNSVIKEKKRKKNPRTMWGRRGEKRDSFPNI